MPRNNYFNSMKPVFYMLKICGVFPFRFENEKNVHRLLLSKAINVISIIVYITMVIAPYIFVFKDEIIISSLSFDQLMNSLPTKSFQTLILLIPFTTWNKKKQLLSYWDQWNTFQVEYEKVTSKAFAVSARYKIKRLSMFITILAILAPPALFVLPTYQTYKLSVGSIITLFFLVYFAFSLILYWYTNYLFIKSIAEEFICAVDQLADDPKAIEKMTRLWITLCNLSEMFDACHSVLFLMHFCMGIVNNLITIYYSLITFFLSSEKTFYAGNVVSCIVGFLCVLIVCWTSNSILKQIDFRLKETLLLKNTIRMNTKLLFSVCSFLQTVDTRKLNITLAGCISANHSLITAIFQIGINYLIILRQFNMSAQKP